MKNDEMIGIGVILCIVFIGLFGGFKQSESGRGLLSPRNVTPEQKQNNIEREITKAQREVESLEKKVEAEIAKKTESKHKGMVTLSYVNRSGNAREEYITIKRSGATTTTISVTGWTVKSLRSGNSISIPKGTYLYFAQGGNSEENIILNPRETLYLITGYSPVGYSFKVNKCSGYLGQYGNFRPSINNSCPRPRDEDLSSIPKLIVNDECLNYIERMPACKVQAKSLPVNWSYECKNFILEKINYPSCINTHKSDKDFYGNEWRVYLKRSDRLWLDRREEIVLYDLEGKIVSTIKY